MDSSVKYSDLLLDNKQIKDVRIPDKDIPVVWHLYWLKRSEYNSRIHAPFKRAVSHNHSFFEMQFITEGEVEYRIGQERVRIGSGQFLIVCPKIDHFSVYRSDVLRRLSIGFDLWTEKEEQIAAQLEYLRSIPYYSAGYSPCMISALELILNEVDERDSFAGYMKRALLNTFLLSVLHALSVNAHRPERLPSAQNKIEASDETVYQAVTNYLQRNISKNICLQELSDVLLISISQLNRRLIRYSGMSFQKLKDSIKCARARELLATDMNMAQISEAIGISNEYSFNRFFKRVEGMTPGRFRESLQTNNYK